MSAVKLKETHDINLASADAIKKAHASDLKLMEAKAAPNPKAFEVKKKVEEPKKA